MPQVAMKVEGEGEEAKGVNKLSSITVDR